MDISIGGANLLATLFPISLLILIVEARAAGPYGGRRSARLAWETLHELGVAGAIAGTVLCAVAVSQDAVLDGVWSQIVLVAGIYQVVAVAVVSTRLLRRIERGD